jgi:hypothetical protein
MSIPPYIVNALNKIQELDPELARALITAISHSHKMSRQDILQYSCRYQNRTMQGMGEMNCSNPYLQAISDYLMGIATGAIKGPGGVLA